MPKSVAYGDTPVGVELKQPANKVEEAFVDLVLGRDHLLFEYPK